MPPELFLRDYLDHRHMYPSPGSGGNETLLHLFQVPAVEPIPLLEVLLHLVIRLPKAVELRRSCLPVWHFCHKVAVQRHICNQPWVISVLDGLIKGEVEGSVFEEESDVLIRDARVLGKVGMVARGTVNAPGIGLAVGCLFSQLPGDSEVCPKPHIW
jgi:hypothetical protein